MEKAGTLLPTEETTELADEPRKTEIMQPKVEEQREETPEEEQARVFAKLKGMKVAEEPEPEPEEEGEEEAPAADKDAEPHEE